MLRERSRHDDQRRRDRGSRDSRRHPSAGGGHRRRRTAGPGRAQLAWNPPASVGGQLFADDAPTVRPAQPTVPSYAVVPPPVGPPPAPRQPRPPPRASPPADGAALLAVATVVAALVGAGGAVILFGGQDDDRPGKVRGRPAGPSWPRRRSPPAVGRRTRLPFTRVLVVGIERVEVARVDPGTPHRERHDEVLGPQAVGAPGGPGMPPWSAVTMTTTCSDNSGSASIADTIRSMSTSAWPRPRGGVCRPSSSPAPAQPAASPTCTQPRRDTRAQLQAVVGQRSARRAEHALHLRGALRSGPSVLQQKHSFRMESRVGQALSCCSTAVRAEDHEQSGLAGGRLRASPRGGALSR